MNWLLYRQVNSTSLVHQSPSSLPLTICLSFSGSLALESLDILAQLENLGQKRMKMDKSYGHFVADVGGKCTLALID